MNTRKKMWWRRGGFVSIAVRTALLSWVISLVSVLLFVILIVPHEKQYFLDSLSSKAHIVEASIRDVASASLVAEDYSELIDHSIEILNNSKLLEYLVITREDGFSLIIQQHSWRTGSMDEKWREGKFSQVEGEIVHTDLSEKSVFHYNTKLSYAGVDWGWLHIGLGLDRYLESISTVYERITKVMLICLLIGLFAAILYAGRMVKPLQKLEHMAHQVASGNLTVSAQIHTHDEVEHLANSFNEMTKALRRRDAALQSIRFAAEHFMKMNEWNKAAYDVLAHLGSGIHADRVQLYKLSELDHELPTFERTHDWKNAEMGVFEDDQDSYPAGDACMSWMNELRDGFIVEKPVSQLDYASQELAKKQGIQAMIMAPIFCEGKFWGFFWVTDHQESRVWNSTITNSLKAVAEIFSAAIQRTCIQQEMIDARETAETANRTKSQFLATMSHEIRTPLNGIIGTASLLDGTDLSEDQDEYVQLIQSSGDALLELLNDILDFSKIEAGKLNLVKNSFNLHETCERITELLMPIAQKKGLDVILHYSPTTPPQVIGDYGRVRQILMNLMTNAVKFTTQGHVYISVDAIEQNGEEASFEFKIKDTGIGIPKNKQHRLFQKFSQADDSNTREFGGTGLGLAICKELVGLMDGEIGVESEGGEGACFWFRITLPIEDNESLRWLQEQYFNREHVIVYDQKRTLGAVISERLIYWGLDTTVCASEEQLLSITKKKPARLVITEECSLSSTLHDHFSEGKLSNSRLMLILPAGTNRRKHQMPHITKPVRASTLLSKTSALLNYAPNTINILNKPANDVLVNQGVGLHILIVEDNQVNQIIARRMITGQGADVEIAENGELAVQQIQKGKKFDLIFMDCQMPCMDGYEATQCIRTLEHDMGLTYTPIIAMTANAMQDEYTRCIEAGMDSYLPKPIKKEDLAKMLHQYALTSKKPT